MRRRSMLQASSIGACCKPAASAHAAYQQHEYAWSAAVRCPLHRSCSAALHAAAQLLSIELLSCSPCSCSAALHRAAQLLSMQLLSCSPSIVNTLVRCPLQALNLGLNLRLWLPVRPLHPSNPLHQVHPSHLCSKSRTRVCRVALPCLNHVLLLDSRAAA